MNYIKFEADSDWVNHHFQTLELFGNLRDSEEEGAYVLEVSEPYLYAKALKLLKSTSKVSLTSDSFIASDCHCCDNCSFFISAKCAVYSSAVSFHSIKEVKSWIANSENPNTCSVFKEYQDLI